MHYSYEKAGLVIDDQPIPWNAEAVIVECLALPSAAGRHREEFQLRIPGRDPVPLDNVSRDEEMRFRLFFRFPPPQQTTNAEIIWRHHRLNEITLPVLQREEFLAQLSLQQPTLAVRLGDRTVACQTFVTTQCRGVVASALLSGPTSLAPLADLHCQVEWTRHDSGESQQIPLSFSSSQLKGKQALLSVCPPKLPKRTGIYVATWKIADSVLATQRIKAITTAQFLRSLRISATRLVVQSSAGEVRLAKQMPPEGEDIARVGPCFLVSSSEVGMAGLCPLRVCGLAKEKTAGPVLLEQDLLVTDGPVPFVPGTLELAEVRRLKAFELRAGTRSLGCLPLTAAPVAAFNAEGGFTGMPEYSWSTAAEDQLQEKLAKLLEPRGNGRG